MEAVIDMMIEEEVGRAKEILAASLPIPQKLVSVIYSLRPAQGEQGIVNALNVKENIVMHEKVNRRIVEEAVPLLTEIVKEGISQGMLSCNNIEERVKMLLIISQHTFDDVDFSDRDVEVYIDMVEKTFGAEADCDSVYMVAITFIAILDMVHKSVVTFTVENDEVYFRKGVNYAE